MRVWVADLVEELFLHRALADLAAGSGGFGDDTGAVVGTFDYWIPDVARVQRQPIGADSTGHLSAAFDEVTGNGCAGDARILISLPAKMGNAGSDSQTWVCGATGDDDVGPAIECLDDRLRADVRVGGDKRRENRLKFRACFQMRKNRSLCISSNRAAKYWQHVITAYDTN